MTADQVRRCLAPLGIEVIEVEYPRTPDGRPLHTQKAARMGQNCLAANLQHMYKGEEGPVYVKSCPDWPDWYDERQDYTWPGCYIFRAQEARRGWPEPRSTMVRVEDPEYQDNLKAEMPDAE